MNQRRFHALVAGIAFAGTAATPPPALYARLGGYDFVDLLERRFKPDVVETL